MLALGVASLDSVTNAVATTLPFSPSRSSSMTDEDITNLRNLQRLLQLVSGLRENENPRMKVNGVRTSNEQMISLNRTPVALQQFDAVQEFLPLISVLRELPQDMQQQLLRLPADLAGKLASRVAARTLKRVLL